jgi:dihydrofolate reductase
MGKVIMAATMSLDGFIADPDDQVGPLFDWYGNGDVEVTGADPDRVFRVSRASADYLGVAWANIGASVIGRHLFDLTNGWEGRPPVGEAVFVVTHQAPADWPHPEAPFTFVTDGVRSAVAQAKAFAGTGTYPSPPATSAVRPWRPGWSTRYRSPSFRSCSAPVSGSSVGSPSRRCCWRTRGWSRAIGSPTWTSAYGIPDPAGDPSPGADLELQRGAAGTVDRRVVDGAGGQHHQHVPQRAERCAVPGP